VKQKEQAIYVCEICGNNGTNKKYIEECEKSHIQIKETKPLYRGNEVYASMVTVTFTDGTEMEYHNMDNDNREYS